MTIHEFFEKARRRYLEAHPGSDNFFEIFLGRLILEIAEVPGQPDNWEKFELDAEEACLLYGSAVENLKFFGMQLADTGDPEEGIWDELTHIAAAFRAVLVEELGLDLPEARVTSLVTEMIEDGMLEEVVTSEGQIEVRPVDNPYNLRIRIVKVPAGDAPEEVRKSWVGAVLPARRESSFAIHRIAGSDALSPGGGGWVVPFSTAIESLSRVDETAAQWFRDHCGDWPALVFRHDEAEIVTE